MAEVSGMRVPATVGVVGAGTMGSGIAQLACAAGSRTMLYDVVAHEVEVGLRRVRFHLDDGARRGRWTAEEAAKAKGRLEGVSDLQALSRCELVIEAVPESLALKRDIHFQLTGVVDQDCVLATNTSSLRVSAIASGVERPDRVVGMHFFNPAPLMGLVEVVAGQDTGERAMAVARATVEAMGKQVIMAADVPGFLVGRCNRPFTLEAQRLLEERIATVEAIDRVCRLGGGFRMGPFELMDLQGIDTSLDIARSFYAQSFGEPRWRPALTSARLADGGRLGRKSGHGFYDYRHGPYLRRDPQPAAPGGGDGVIVVAGEGALARDLHAHAMAAGWEVADGRAGDPAPFLVVDCRGSDDGEALPAGPRAVLCARGSLAALRGGGDAVGFYALPPLGGAHLVELTQGLDASSTAASAAARFFASLGKPVAWVGDAPGLVLGRIVCQIINEAAFALGAGLGTAQDIDDGMRLGLNWPRGPLSWADEIGLDHVLGVLDALGDEYREERYRAAPMIRHLVSWGRLGRRTGSGFFEHTT